MFTLLLNNAPTASIAVVSAPGWAPNSITMPVIKQSISIVTKPAARAADSAPVHQPSSSINTRCISHYISPIRIPSLPYMKTLHHEGFPTYLLILEYDFVPPVPHWPDYGIKTRKPHLPLVSAAFDCYPWFKVTSWIRMHHPSSSPPIIAARPNFPDKVTGEK